MQPPCLNCRQPISADSQWGGVICKPCLDTIRRGRGYIYIEVTRPWWFVGWRWKREITIENLPTTYMHTGEDFVLDNAAYRVVGRVPQLPGGIEYVLCRRIASLRPDIKRFTNHGANLNAPSR